MVIFDQMQVTRVPYEDTQAYAIVIHNVFTAEECQALIDRSETQGYAVAYVNAGDAQILDTDYRRGSRCIIDDGDVANAIWQRVKAHVPNRLDGRRALEVNERLRFLQYNSGDFFRRHPDGSYRRPDSHPKGGDVSLVTLQLYLNEGFEGGSTRFFARMEDGSEHFDVVPKTGSVLLFQHRLYHSGEELISGRKYTIRTEVMYTRRPQPEPQRSSWFQKLMGR